MNSFYSEEELIKIGFKKIGRNVLISKKASIYGAKDISIGSNVRVDDFCILSGYIKLGDYIHIAAATLLYGGEVGIEIDDFSTISSRSAVYAISDDYSGEYMTNPMIDNKYKNLIQKKVKIGKHVIIGTNTTILPGTLIGDGVAIGACSLLNKSYDSWGIYYGIPARFIDKRSDNLLKIENEIFNND